jgi:predicted DNA-binding antitoxin AbrB/MazE fold protein
MTITIEAIYEGGVLKPAEPLQLVEHSKVRVTIHSPSLDITHAYGIMGWQGGAEAIERIALDPAFLPEEAG